jgi:glycosyltransferase involved in cell wall biosynthesis
MEQMDITKVWVVIAAYNEAQTIAETIANVLVQIGNVVVVDDCSIDDTAQKALDAGAYVLSHPINLGQGAALQTGIE